jgi:hypothetical protein
MRNRSAHRLRRGALLLTIALAAWPATIAHATIAFSSGVGPVQVEAALGTAPRTLGPGVVRGISPDGKTVLVEGTSGASLVLMDVATGVTTPLPSGAMPPVNWSANGGRLIFATQEQNSPVDHLQLCTRVPLRCHIVARGAISGSALSPDGRSYAYGDQDFERVVLVGSDGRRRVISRAYDAVSLWTSAGLLVSNAPSAKQGFALRRNDGRLTPLFVGHFGQPILVPIALSPNGRTMLFEALVACPPIEPSAAVGVCLETAALVETSPIGGGPPRPASAFLSQAGTAGFAPDGSIVAAFSTLSADSVVNNYVSPFVFDRAPPPTLGDQPVAAPGRAALPPRTTTQVAYFAAVAG